MDCGAQMTDCGALRFPENGAWTDDIVMTHTSRDTRVSRLRGLASGRAFDAAIQRALH
jgi:hypothetical protein